jgi:mono/diheme cytochrome c family protein
MNEPTKSPNLHRLQRIPAGLASMCWLGVLALCAVPQTPAAAAVHADFLRDATPFLEKHCIECHGGKTTKAELDLKKLDRADAAILKSRKVWMNVLNQVGAGEMPPKKRPRPTLEELEKFTHAVETAFERAELAAPPDPGRITIRRLNRNEYNNTVRDLLGADFNAAEDFPPDDIGHGFDNISDVLTVSPLLTERYLDAADAIMRRVILPELPKPARRYLSGRYLQPNNAQTPQGRFRQMDPTSPEAVHSGPFTAAGGYLKFSEDADLFFRATLYATTKGTAPVKVALFLSGKNLADVSSDAEVEELVGANLPKLKPLKIVKIFEITAREQGKPQTIEASVNRMGNIERAGIALLKPASGEEPAHLFIESLWSEGPMDTRPASHRMILACSPDKPQPQQTREVLTRLLTRGYRRPATAAEIEAQAKFVDAAVAGGQKWEAAIQQVIQALLCSPKFLFRVELDQRPDAKSQHPIDEFQLASRLSYFLWSSMPDDELFALAEKGALNANLDAQVARMLKDPKAAALVDNFALQWLQLKRLQIAAPDAKQFPNFNDSLRRAMMRETQLFFGEIVREDRSVLELLEGDFTYLNEALARHYGIADTAGNVSGAKSKEKLPGGKPIPRNEFVRVALPMTERGGLLAHASMLTVTSNPTRTSPVKRGRWVLEQLLGTPPPPPPANVPELDDQKELSGTLRQRMEQHRANPNCASCHTQMDAIGFAMENYDAIGAWRTKDGEDEIDATGTLPDGKSFTGAAGLKAVLKEKKALFLRNLAEKMLTYALGRGLEYYDSRAIRQITADLAKQDYTFSALVKAVVKSDPFRQRRGKDMAAADGR